MKDSKYKIHLFKEQKEIDCLKDSNILETTLAVAINHTHACGGQGKCSTGRVSVMEDIKNCSPRNAAEQEIADKLKFPSKIRLACQTRINGNITIRRIVSDKQDLDINNYTAFAEKIPPYV